MREILGVPRDEKHRAGLCRCPDDGIGQFDPMAAAKADGAFRDPFVHGNDIKAVQKVPRRSFEFAIGSDHDLHPGDDADRLFCIALEFAARLASFALV